MSSKINSVWLVAGDFDDILSQSDKVGDSRINHSRSSKFLSCINHCNLIDLGFKDNRYTWSNHRHRRKSLI